MSSRPARATKKPDVLTYTSKEPSTVAATKKSGKAQPKNVGPKSTSGEDLEEDEEDGEEDDNDEDNDGDDNEDVEDDEDIFDSKKGSRAPKKMTSNSMRSTATKPAAKTEDFGNPIYRKTCSSN